MIKFFRKIRKEFLIKGHFRGYITYAVGEIILVVMGILIALQINNWNSERKNRVMEQEYYCRFMEDVVQDREQIDKLIVDSKTRLEASYEALNLLQKTQARKKDVGIQLGKSIRAVYADFKPNNAAFEDMKSGANLNIMTDKSVIKALNTYFNKQSELSSIVKVNSENALNIYFSENDLFANGRIHSLMASNRFRDMDRSLYNSIVIDEDDLLSEEMRLKLYNDTFSYISVNNRHIELYEQMIEAVESLSKILVIKCETH